MPRLLYTLLEAMRVAIGAQSTRISRGTRLLASCVSKAFEVPKSLVSTSMPFTQVLLWVMMKETLVYLAISPPHTCPPFAFCRGTGVLIGVGSYKYP